jgi:hypothetical protein
MSKKKNFSPRVGELRPSQLMFTYGVGAMIDLPKFSVIVSGLEDWPTSPEFSEPIIEDRLLSAVRSKKPLVKQLLAPPIPQEISSNPFDSLAHIGVPVATFPRWMVCPQCHTLAQISSGIFKIKENPFHPERTAYRHESCNKAKKPPDVFPARFLVSCEKGHLDDFPWDWFVHTGDSCGQPQLALYEISPSGEASDLYVKCHGCDKSRRMSEAFGKENRNKLPKCRGRHPHLRSYDSEPCEYRMRPLILGATNTWFPAVFSTIAIPVDSGKLGQLVNDHWRLLKDVDNISILVFLRNQGSLGALSEFSNEDVVDEIQKRRREDAGELPPPSTDPDLLAPEWQSFSNFDPEKNSEDFFLTPVEVPIGYQDVIEKVILVERLREVRALIGFTRLDALGELTDPELKIHIEPAPISRAQPSWVPATEVRGEGVFIQFKESKIKAWLEKDSVKQRSEGFFASHKRWRAARYIADTEGGFPGMRYVLIHTFAHLLIRQLSLDAGYSASSIRERIYARSDERDEGPMAGLLIYTAAPDSEGTLGGLVELGSPEKLNLHIAKALESALLCASDPLCSEHPPSSSGRTLHGAACHACTFLSETSCERGNKYLDRAAVIPTVANSDLAFFKAK